MYARKDAGEAATASSNEPAPPPAEAEETAAHAMPAEVDVKPVAEDQQTAARAGRIEDGVDLLVAR